MAKKYEDMDKGERKALDKVLAHGFAYDNEDFPSCSGFISKYGLCSSCKNFQFTRSEYKVLLSKCSYTELVIRDNDPIQECNVYEKRGELTLNQMLGMAYLLETHRKKVGFLDDGE